MATIVEKSSRRNRIQFSVGDELYLKYEANQDRAKRLRAILDYSKDFEKWLATQVEHASSELSKLEQKRAQAAIDKSAASFSDLTEEAQDGDA